MYPLAINNYNGIALELMRDPLKVDTIARDSPTSAIFDRNFMHVHLPESETDLSSARYIKRQKLGDGRILEVEFMDSSHWPRDSWSSSLEITLRGSEPNGVGFNSEESCRTAAYNLVQHGGIYSWLNHIGENATLERFLQYSVNKCLAHYSRLGTGGPMHKWEIPEGKAGKATSVKVPDSDEIYAKHQQFTSEVLAVLRGQAGNITIS